MGAVVNMRPDLFKAVVAYVPFVDVINTELDDTLPLTAGEWEEWGNPVKSKENFQYMLSYSPYDNVAAKDYPAMLVKTSLNDSQVLFHEPTKWVAKLRSMKTDKNPLLLKVNMGAGHGGASGRYDALREAAFDYAFMLTQMGDQGVNTTARRRPLGARGFFVDRRRVRFSYCLRGLFSGPRKQFASEAHTYTHPPDDLTNQPKGSARGPQRVS
jgi:hypothetical protein